MLGALAAAGLAAISLAAGWTLYEYRRAPVESLRGRYAFRPYGFDYEIEIGLAAPGVKLTELPGHFIIAVLLHEDELFFSHGGFNWPEIRRRVRAFLSGRDKLRGGSSLTQQLAKNTLAPGHLGQGARGWLRKAREAIYAVKIERHYDKREILTLYLNMARWAPGNLHGIARAAEFHFGKQPKDLSLHESIYLAGVLPAPTELVRSIRERGSDGLFNYLRASTKYSDLFRILADGWGWDYLEHPHKLGSYEALERMQRYNGPPPGFAPGFEVALQMRVASATFELRKLIWSLMPQPGAQDAKRHA